MKKLLCLVLCFLLFPQSALADEGILRMPASLQIIEEEAFYGNTALHEIILPSGITRIEQKAFAFSSVKRINLPASIEYIADDAFYGCNIEFAEAEGDYCKKWCEDHGIKVDKDDQYEGEPFIIS